MARYLVLTSFLEAQREYRRDAILTEEDFLPWPAETREKAIADLIAAGKLDQITTVVKGVSKGAAATPASDPAPAGEGGLPPASAAPTIE